MFWTMISGFPGIFFQVAHRPAPRIRGIAGEITDGDSQRFALVKEVGRWRVPSKE
jgi:RNase P/RNase MRP subunit p29